MSQKNRRTPRSDTISIDTVERDACEVDFTTMPNDIVNTRLLSWPAKAMLWYIVSKPHDWKVIPEQLRTVSAKRLSLPAVRKLLKEIVDAGYGHRELVFDERHRIIGKRQIFSNRPKWRARAPEAQAGDSVSRFSDIRKDRQTVNLSPVLSNDSKLTTPLPPPAEAHADPPGEKLAVPKISGGLGAKIDSPSAAAMPETKNPVLDEASPAPVAATETGSAREVVGKILKPVTFALFWQHYEPHNSRNRSKAEERWANLTMVEQVHAYAALGQYEGYCGRKQQRWEQAWRYLALRLFRQFPLPDEKSDPPAPKAMHVRPEPDAVLASALGLRAAQDGWAADLHDFVRVKGRLPDHKETMKLETDGPVHTLSNAEALGQPAHALAPYARGTLQKRWRLTAKACALHNLPEPTFDEFLAPARKLIADADSARDMPPLPFMRTDSRMDDEIPI